MFNTNLLDKKKLLEALDPLGYSDRMKKVALLGRGNKDAAGYARWGAKEASVLLPACSGETVRQWLADLGYAIANWHGIAKRHPEVVLACAMARA
ncbi:MAG: hypothetical protein K0Q90_2004 [Paenibacillaceae bacterium]|nr:hypothetical protein [Paenibacillaceae bacterium]